MAVVKCADDDADQIDDEPDAQAAEGEEVKNSTADFPDIEAVEAQAWEEEAEQEGGQDALVADEVGATVRTAFALGADDAVALRAVQHVGISRRFF